VKFVDQVRVLARAGRGGDGVVGWRREKYVPRGGPAGGDGGEGGDVVFVADRGLSTLLDLRFRQILKAESGRPGGWKQMHGRSGEDLVVKVPVGTMVFAEGPADENAEIGDSDREVDDDEMQSIWVVPDADDLAGDDLDPDEAMLGGRPLGTPDLAAGIRAPQVAAAGQLLGDLAEDGATLVVARGGKGGRGNIHFRSSTNRAPDYAEPGTPGEALWLRLELKLLADVGIVGFPNVGKSTFIRHVSRARPKVAAYPFTTLVPNLGVVALSDKRSMVIADVPGLIKGAAEGKGLGLRFLRHLERTRVLLHVLAPDPDPEREPLADLDVLEAELARYGPQFEGRPRVVALNKADILDDEDGRALVAELKKQLRARNIPLFVISAATGQGTDKLLEAIWRRLHPTS
jgi:GTP-binding protein